jgi:hypothetical protein
LRISQAHLDYVFQAKYFVVNLAAGVACDSKRLSVAFAENSTDTRWGVVLGNGTFSYHWSEIIALPLYSAVVYEWNNIYVFGGIYFGLAVLSGIFFFRNHPTRVSRMCLLFSGTWHFASGCWKLHALLVASTMSLLPSVILDVSIAILCLEWIPAILTIWLFRWSRNRMQHAGLFGVLLAVTTFSLGSGFYVAPALLCIGSIFFCIVCIEIIFE